MQLKDNGMNELLLNSRLADDLLNLFCERSYIGDLIEDLNESGKHLTGGMGFWRMGDLILIDHDFHGEPYGDISVYIAEKDFIIFLYENLNNYSK